MQRLKQGQVYLRVQTPLGQDQVVLMEFSAREYVSNLFECDLLLATDRSDVSLEELIGKVITVEIELEDGEKSAGSSSSSSSSLFQKLTESSSTSGAKSLIQQGLNKLSGGNAIPEARSLSVAQMLRSNLPGDISFGFLSSLGKVASGLSKSIGAGLSSKMGGGQSSTFGDKITSLAAAASKSLSAGKSQGEKPSGFSSKLLGKLTSRLNSDAEGGSAKGLGKLGAGLSAKLGGAITGAMGSLGGEPMSGGVNPMGGEAGGIGSGSGGITNMLLKGLSSRFGVDADAEPIGGILSGLSGKLIDKARGNGVLSNIIDRLGGDEALKGKVQGLIDKLDTGKIKSSLSSILDGDEKQPGLLDRGRELLGKFLGKSPITAGLGGILGGSLGSKGIVSGTGLAAAIKKGPAPRRPAFGASGFKQKGQIQRDLGRKIRFFHGVVGEISQGATDLTEGSNITFYKAKLHPKLWLLKYSGDCRIFQNKTAMEIIADIFKENDITDVQNKTVKSGQAVREYCVQYNESNFDFISRLMEEEGVYYYFIHTEDAHTLVLADDPQAHHPCPHVQEAYVEKRQGGDLHFFNAVQNCDIVQRVVPQEQAFTDYDFELPSNNLAVKSSGKGKGGRVYEYPGKYYNSSDGMDLASRRIEGREVPKDMLYGQSTIPFFEPGGYFKLQGHTKPEANRRYVLLQVDHHAQQLFEEKTHTIYTNNFSSFAFDSVPFRPMLKTPKPKIPGTQTARVTGKSGEEIWTDEYGRVKVKFHWDESDLDDEKTSCWVRVAQGWAGNGWGMLFTPRIGQEVVVSFLEGDPDCPLITGSVYNGEKRAPYLPDNPTVSTIKSKSSKGSSGYNEIRIQDLAGQEQLYMHAERNWDIEVEKDKNEIIGANETKIIKSGTRSVTLQGRPYQERSSLPGMTGAPPGVPPAPPAPDAGEGGSGEVMSSDDRLVLDKGSRSILLNADDGNVKANHTTLLKNGNHSVGIVNGNQVVNIGAGNRITQLKQGNDILKVEGDAASSIGNDYTITVGGNLDIKVVGDITINGKSLKSDTQVETAFTAGTSIAMKATTSVDIDSAGTVSAQAATSFKAASEGTANIEAGSMATVKASGMTQISGAVIKLN